jgi:hypothetical protein
MQSSNKNKVDDALEQFKILKTQLRFKNMVNYKFPDDYPTDIKNLVLKNNVNK